MTNSARVRSIFVSLLLASGVSGYGLPKASFTSLSAVKPISSSPRHAEVFPLRMSKDDETPDKMEPDSSNKDTAKVSSSKREMLKFAVPALGIFLASPLLSNIDNAFVGKTVGTVGLAALSPATTCTDQMLYFFSFLSRATTGLVSRARGLKTKLDEKNKATADAGSAPLTVALMSGFLLSIFYAFCTPKMLAALNVTPALQGSAASYIYWRGAIAWAALAQSVSLSILLATKDAITPLKIVGLAAGVNVIADFLLCVFPFRWGVSGAAAATTFATLFSSGFMVRGLKKKGILPKVRLPSRKEVFSLMEFMGPLMGITITRLFAFVKMQNTAMTLGVKQLAAYQLCVNVAIFFLLFGEPLSQLSQNQLPALIDSGDGEQVKSNLKSVLSLGAAASLIFGSVAGLTTFFGSTLFSSDPVVQSLARGGAPAVFLAVATSIFTVTVDGAMLASKDFGFMLGWGVIAVLGQTFLLKTWCSNISTIFATFTLRLGSYALVSLLRAGFGYGVLGRTMFKGRGGSFFQRRKKRLINGAAVNGCDSSEATDPISTAVVNEAS